MANISADDLAALDAACKRSAGELSSARTLREAVDAANQVSIPHNLRGIPRMSVPSLKRLDRALADRLEDIVDEQIERAGRIRDRYTLEKELAKLKVNDWYVLMPNYPELYTKAINASKQIERRLSGPR